MAPRGRPWWPPGLRSWGSPQSCSCQEPGRDQLVTMGMLRTPRGPEQRIPSHCRRSREPPSPRSLWRGHGVRPLTHCCPLEASCTPSSPRSPQRRPSEEEEEGERQAYVRGRLTPSTHTKQDTYVFLFKVQEVVDGLVHQLRTTCDRHQVGVGRPTLRKPEINLEQTDNAHAASQISTRGKRGPSDPRQF